jgi:hypothetical protein
MYQKNQSDFTTSAIDLLLVSTLKAETIALASAALTSTVAGLPASSTAVVYADGGTFTGSATKTALGTTTGALYQVTSAADGTVASINVINKGPNSAAGKTITFSEKTLVSSFGVSAAEALTYTGAVINTTATTISLDNSNGGINPAAGWTVGQTIQFGFTFTTTNGGLDFGLQGTTGTITAASATGFTIASGNAGGVQTGTYVSGDITYSGNSGVSGDITYTPATANLELPSTNFTQQPVALYAGVGGDITLTLASDSTEVKFAGVAAGTFLDVLCTSVNTAAAGTPASGLLALR